MSVLKKPSGKASSIPAGLAWGGMTSLAVTAAIAALLAWLVSAEKIQHNHIGYGVMILLILASFCGAKVAYGKIKRQRLMVCMISGGVYFVLLLSMTALFFGGQYSAVGETALMVMCGCLLAVLLNSGMKSPGKTRKTRKAYC